MSETVSEHCKHKDCIYRIKIGTQDPICTYIEKEHRPRGCKISECDKYKAGSRRVGIQYGNTKRT